MSIANAVPKPFIGVIHCKGDTKDVVMDLAKREIDTYVENGINGILVETYFGTYTSVEKVLASDESSNE